MKNARAGREDRVENIVGAHYLCRLHIVAVSFVLVTKGLAKLGNIVAETLLRMQMFPNLAARETCVAETNFAARKQKMFLPWSQKHFCFPDTNSLATPGNITRNSR